MHKNRRFAIYWVIGLIFLIVLVAPQPNVQAQSNPISLQAGNVQDANACQVILKRAYETLNNSCNTLERNRACYGNNNVKALFDDTFAGAFSNPGDKVPIKMVKWLSTLPLDVQTGTWGLSLLKLQANLPDTLPGQNVTFLVFGDTGLQNKSGDMNAFYFSSGLGNPTCKGAPQDGIVVRSPDHMKITFSANGVQITIASTIIMHAEANKQMTIQLIEGKAEIKANNVSRLLYPGQMTTIKLGGAAGYDASDVPTVPKFVPIDPTLVAVLHTAHQMEAPKADDFSMRGCISKIDAHTVTIFNYIVSRDSILNARNLQVGDCLSLKGTLNVDNDTVIIIPTEVDSSDAANIRTEFGLNIDLGHPDTNNSSQNKGNDNTNSNQGQPKQKQQDNQEDKGKGDDQKTKDQANQDQGKHKPGDGKGD